MALSEFTSYEDIRAALGVTSDELEDTTLSLRLYDFSLRADLNSIDPELIATFRIVESQSDPDEASISFSEMTHLFATYSVARHLLTSLPMFSFKEVTDGKASDVRFSQNPYEATIERVEASYQQYRPQLANLLAIVKNGTGATITPTLRTFLSVSSPSRDPVTGT